MWCERERGWRRKWRLTIVSLLAVTLPLAAGSASASAQTLLGSINVPLDGSKVYSAPLVPGGVYRIDASGTFTQTVGIDLDAVYCYFSDNPVPGACSPPGHSNLVIVRYEGDTSLTADLDALNPATTLAYNPLHTYQETFTAPSSSRLEVFYRSSPTFFFSGAIRLDLYLVSLPPGAGPGGGTPPPEPPGTQTKRRILDPAVAWGNPSVQTPLAPGGELIATSPPISANQRGVTVALSGDASGETAVVIGTPKNIRHGFKTGRPTRGDCVRAAANLFKRFQLKDEDEYGIIPEDERYTDAVLVTTVFLINCLDLVKALDEQARKASLPSAAGAARVSCKVRAHPISVRVNRAARTTSWRTQRASRREPAQRLRTSCKRARNGTVRVHVRAASRRVKLRKVLGPRLVVGAYRSAAAKGTANVRATFTRR